MAKFFRRLLINTGILGEILGYLWRQRLWWMIPMVTTLLLFGVLLVLGSSTGLGPFIYTLF